MFKVKNASDSFKSLNIIHNGEILTIGLSANETSEEIADNFIGYFQENAVEWAIVIQPVNISTDVEAIAKEPVVIKSIGKPEIERPQVKRKYKKRG